MATRGRPPEGQAGKVTRSFDNVRGDGIRHGWLDGPIHGIICHACKKSRPCLKALIGKDANCPGCLTPLKPRWIGFVPVRRLDGRPWVIAIPASRFEVADGIKPGSRVSWGRDEGTGAGVWILPRDTGAEWRVYYPDVKPEADLTEPLAVLWESPELIPALRAHWSATAPTVPPAAAGGTVPATLDAARAAGEVESGKIVEQLRKRMRPPPADVPTVGELLPLPSPNGKHQ